jgi:transposase InsO family protein
LSAYGEPNAAWSVDLKGCFYTGNGCKCNPLTATDVWSRYLLGCFALGARTGHLQVQPLLENLFREFGLPLAIRTDNGPPFGSAGLASLSALSVWLMQLGIHPDHTRPAKPQDNARHERFHRTLKAATAKPPKATLRTQQKAFDDFLEYYNFDRPHQALNKQCPADVYAPSARPYPRKLAQPEYAREWTVRKVKHKGGIMWDGTEVYLTQSLAGHHVGLKPIEEECWMVYFYATAIAIFDEPTKTIRPMPKEKTQ